MSYLAVLGLGAVLLIVAVCAGEIVLVAATLWTGVRDWLARLREHRKRAAGEFDDELLGLARLALRSIKRTKRVPTPEWASRIAAGTEAQDDCNE